MAGAAGAGAGAGVCVVVLDAAGAEVSALVLAGVTPVDAQPLIRLVHKSMANKEILPGFIVDLHLTGHSRGFVICSILKLPH